MVPRELGRPWLVGLGLLLLLAGPSGADNCNQECREKHNFYSCLTSQCFYMYRPDCGKCTANGSYCDSTTPALNGTCQVSGTNQVRIYSDCLLNCACQSGDIAVEAEAILVPNGEWIGRDWKRCLNPL